MGVIDRTFRLTNETGGLGLSCGPFGLSLAGVPLLRKSGADFAARPPEEIEALVKAAYGAATDSVELLPAFDAVARALNREDFAHAVTVAVLTRLPELDWDGAVRLANAEHQLRKYDPNEPRDWRGCWTDDDGTDMSGQDRLPQNPVDFGPEESESAAGNDDSEDGPDNRSSLERKYDDLGPVAFAKEAILFGDQLGREGKHLTPEEQASARAEYDFVQSRLSFWLGHADKPFMAEENLISAALTVYIGAYNGGVIAVHDGFPPSMLDASLPLVGQDNHQPDISFRESSIGGIAERETTAPEEFGALSDITETGPSGAVGDIISADVAEIDFDNGIANKGIPLEGYLANKMPGVRVLEPGAKVFDLYDDILDQAISAKVLDPLSYSYLSDPRKIYGRVKGYVDAAANYNKPRAYFDVDPSKIESRVVHLGVRDYISPSQWRQLNRAVIYGKGKGVSVVITRIR
jgi:hypothetical protein